MLALDSAAVMFLHEQPFIATDIKFWSKHLSRLIAEMQDEEDKEWVTWP